MSGRDETDAQRASRELDPDFALDQALDTAGDIISTLDIAREFRGPWLTVPRWTREAAEQAHYLAHGFSMLLAGAQLHVPEGSPHYLALVSHLQDALAEGLHAMAEVPDNIRHAQTREYDPSQVRVTFGGVEIKGFLDGPIVDEREVRPHETPGRLKDEAHRDLASAADYATRHASVGDCHSVAAACACSEEGLTTRQIRARLAPELRGRMGEMLLEEVRAGEVVKLSVSGRYMTRVGAQMLNLTWEDAP